MFTGDYRDSLFDTEARILADSGTHVVVALRIDKDLLRRNLTFAAALADTIGEPRRTDKAACALRGFSGTAAALLLHPFVLAANWLLTVLLLA